jgi:hypothetical protein
MTLKNNVVISIDILMTVRVVDLVPCYLVPLPSTTPQTRTRSTASRKLCPLRSISTIDNTFLELEIPSAFPSLFAKLFSDLVQQFLCV